MNFFDSGIVWLDITLTFWKNSRLYIKFILSSSIIYISAPWTLIFSFVPIPSWIKKSWTSSLWSPKIFIYSSFVLASVVTAPLVLKSYYEIILNGIEDRI
jgi:hypothetical protein